MDYAGLYYPESNFGGFTDVDGTIAFYIRVNSLADKTSVLLDVGCGRGRYAEDPISVRRELRKFKGKCKRVIGIDLSRSMERNPFLDEFRLIEGNQWPVSDWSIDVCICDHVIEHVENPEKFFSECSRVIKKGGYLCIRTTNVFSYVGFFAKLVPFRRRFFLLEKVQNNVAKIDLFPTYYKCNTRGKIRRMLEKFGFDSCVYGYEAEPAYLSFSKFFYILGVLHQRFSPSILRTTIFAFGRRL